MASEIAKLLHRIAWTTKFAPGEGDQTITAAMDAELAEVREVLDSLTFNQLPDGPCWCAITHPTDECKRARALYEKLRVDADKE